MALQAQEGGGAAGRQSRQKPAMSPVFERWDRRLRNWALWKAGVQSSGAGSAYDGQVWESAPRPPPPLVGEALDTDDLVLQLSTEHVRAVTAYYVWTGSVEESAMELGISRDTLADRITAAQFRLEDLDQARRRGMTKPPPSNTPMDVPAKCD